MTGVLDGVRVLDLSRFIAGPLCCQMLGDMGAEVIKVERPGGEDARMHAPFHRGESIYTMVYNRNKYGATLDTRHPRARELLAALIERSDIVVENYRPGTMAAMGLSYQDMTAIRPDVILVSISGFGQTGPLAGRALFDAIAQAASGLMSVTGPADGEPVLTGAYIADHIAGYHGMIGALLALMHRRATGEGQHVDVSSLDALFSTLGTRPAAYAMLGEQPRRTGSRDLLNAPANVFPARDGHVYLHAGTDGLFPKLCAAMGRPDLAADPRYRTVEERRAHTAELEEEVAAWTGRHDCAHITGALAEAGVPCGKVAQIPEVVESEQIAAREMMLDVEHPELGPLRLPGIPIKMGGTPGTVRKAPPRVGEDNDHVYRDLLGLSEQEIEKLADDGAL
ncbi:CaiB/BaiF CoA transferase family protein [Actinoallomurus acaciae]|uniref:CaiB/BaiF CoA transferase family protein n=1 Tax=Actinoallomurus acaciae TaxID=502577 RepID=A0ABV5YXS9_9ACTN